MSMAQRGQEVMGQYSSPLSVFVSLFLFLSLTYSQLQTFQEMK